MSTAHTGSYCAVKDKMMLGRAEAKKAAERMKGMQAYQCEVCGKWHLAHRQKAGTSRIYRNEAKKRTKKITKKGYSKSKKWIP